MASIPQQDGTLVRFCCGCRALHPLDAFDGPTRSCRAVRRARRGARSPDPTPTPTPTPTKTEEKPEHTPDALQALVDDARTVALAFAEEASAVARAVRERDADSHFHGLGRLSTASERALVAQERVMRALYDLYDTFVFL